MSIKVTAKVGDKARGHCHNYFENVDMIGNRLGFLFKRLSLLNTLVTKEVQIAYRLLLVNCYVLHGNI